mmetsp:Transcript_41719/g.115042  ORF Transcript_41719/g.115042 Transcript_41719/m.115042 type:complete len:193 (-) Transcript_41719:68-646(-)|eukprot:CAMPEP_0117508454 /NCGR_PEP_ID=MMETSP0784-20121206/26960_1 /TAXON_ID=39447 /ORGANISM="" /LENGTH=192 /DNA_ID=CAMNT_0005304015 /DNA_START=143 /DNA_END=721 /DNA_ORIENTATION=+
MAAEAQYAAEQFVVTPEYVNSLTAPTDRFLCPLSHNVYNIDFVNFKIRAVEEGRDQLLFEVGSDNAGAPPPPADENDDSSRFIQYHFGPGFLDIKTIGTTLEFTIGEYPLHNFRMIERHYFRDQLIRSYDFELPFVIPNTKNTWEVIYAMPELSDEWKAALISAPWETRSDSFYFVNGQLVMHNKAAYNYGE